jgi:integrase
VTRRMRAALRAAGLDSSHRFHDLRHTFGTRMAAAGVSVRTLMEWMGHRDLQTTLLYADFAPGDYEARLVAGAFTRDDDAAPASSLRRTNRPGDVGASRATAPEVRPDADRA